MFIHNGLIRITGMKNNYKTKTYFECEKCHYQSAQWLGRCPSCGAWNSFVAKERIEGNHPIIADKKGNDAKPLDYFQFEGIDHRYMSGIKEFDRVLGGGVVSGSVTLIAGEPGIGKSTLILQVADKLAKNAGKLLYVTAEESIKQVYMRAKRLSVHSEQLYLLAETDLDMMIAQMERLKPKITIVDSIQIINDTSIPSTPGSVNQVKNCTYRLMEIAKKNNIAVIIIGHVTKGGEIAGPKTLEHMVDVVLYLEGERLQSFRLLRGIKNRFGAT
ncbi:MAG: DNA repair protein RadA, partial [Candidatus Atribacteria bacterium]|nr:DNA repair protein RadA [Candidatus Atribacteria bacterium]